MCAGSHGTFDSHLDDSCEQMQTWIQHDLLRWLIIYQLDGHEDIMRDMALQYKGAVAQAYESPMAHAIFDSIVGCNICDPVWVRLDKDIKHTERYASALDMSCVCMLPFSLIQNIMNTRLDGIGSMQQHIEQCAFDASYDLHCRHAPWCVFLRPLSHN